VSDVGQAEAYIVGCPLYGRDWHRPGILGLAVPTGTGFCGHSVMLYIVEVQVSVVG